MQELAQADMVERYRARDKALPLVAMTLSCLHINFWQ